MSKLTKPKIRIHNSETDEIIDREMTDQEYEVYLEKISRMENIKREEEAKAAARQAILDRLGLTEDEAKILLG